MRQAQYYGGGGESSADSFSNGVVRALDQGLAGRYHARMQPTRSRVWPVLLAMAVALGAPAGALAAVVICTDNTRHEGEVTEKDDVVIVKTRKGVVRLRRAKVAEILRTETYLTDRFRADPNAKDLLILASRAGIPLKLEQAENIVKMLSGCEDASVEAELLLHRFGLTAEHTRAIVERHVAEFKKEFGDKAAVYEGDHYVVLTPLGVFWARKVGHRMNGIFKEYQKRLIFKEKVTDRFVVKIYSSRSEYLKHGGPPRTVAYFSSGRRELVGYRQPSDDQLFEQLYHEGMHQFLHFYVPNPPIWFDEGLAEYFETARRSRARSAKRPTYRILPNYDALESFKRSLRNRSSIPLWKLLAMSREEFYGPKMALCYAESWAFTHFLVESKDKRLNKLWFNYFFSLRDGADQEEVNRKVFGRVDLNRLEKMFEEYVKQLRLPASRRL